MHPLESNQRHLDPLFSCSDLRSKFINESRLRKAAEMIRVNNECTSNQGDDFETDPKEQAYLKGIFYQSISTGRANQIKYSYPGELWGINTPISGSNTIRNICFYPSGYCAGWGGSV